MSRLRTKRRILANFPVLSVVGVVEERGSTVGETTSGVEADCVYSGCSTAAVVMVVGVSWILFPEFSGAVVFSSTLFCPISSLVIVSFVFLFKLLWLLMVVSWLLIVPQLSEFVNSWIFSSMLPAAPRAIVLVASTIEVVSFLTFSVLYSCKLLQMVVLLLLLSWSCWEAWTISWVTYSTAGSSTVAPENCFSRMKFLYLNWKGCRVADLNRFGSI